MEVFENILIVLVIVCDVVAVLSCIDNARFKAKHKKQGGNSSTNNFISEKRKHASEKSLKEEMHDYMKTYCELCPDKDKCNRDKCYEW